MSATASIISTAVAPAAPMGLRLSGLVPRDAARCPYAAGTRPGGDHQPCPFTTVTR